MFVKQKFARYLDETLLDLPQKEDVTSGGFPSARLQFLWMQCGRLYLYYFDKKALRPQYPSAGWSAQISFSTVRAAVLSRKKTQYQYRVFQSRTRTGIDRVSRPVSNILSALPQDCGTQLCQQSPTPG